MTEPMSTLLEKARTYAAAELQFYLHGALIGYPDDATERIMAGADQYAARIEAEAVNAYEPLVKALQWFVQFHSGHVLPPELVNAMEAARAALAAEEDRSHR